MIKELYFSLGNYGVIDAGDILPYKNAPKKSGYFRACCFSSYDNNFLYHTSVHGTRADAIQALKNCGFTCDYREILPLSYTPENIQKHYE